MYNVEDLVCQFAWIDVVAVRVVGDKRNVKRADVRNEGESLKEVVLLRCQLEGRLHHKQIAYPVFVVDRYRQLSQTAHSSTGDER